MKNKLFSAAVCFLLTVNILSGILPVSAKTAGVNTENIIDGIISYNLSSSNAASVQEWIDGALSQDAGNGSEWYAIALMQSGTEYNFSGYSAALRDHATSGKSYPAATHQRIALTLTGCGLSDDSFVRATLDSSIGTQGVASWVFGLHLLNNGCVSAKYTAGDIVDKLLSLRLKDGGWAVMGATSDVDVTAMTVSALAPYYKSHSGVRTAIDGALSLLSEKQLESGGYKGFGAENPESTAQVITALCSLGINPGEDTRFIKNGGNLLDGLLSFRLDNGSFCHVKGGNSDFSATYQALYSMVAINRLQKKLSPLFILRDNVLPAISSEDNNAPEESTVSSASEPTQTSSHSSDRSQTEDSSSKVSDTLTESAVSGLSDNTEVFTPEDAKPDKSHKSKNGSYKPWVCAVILAAAAAVSLVLWLRKKRHYRNFLFVLIISAAAVCAVLLTDFQSAGSYYGESTAPSDSVGSASISIRCDTIAGKSDSEYIPADGVILETENYDISKGESVFSLLVRAAKKHEIQLENKGAVSVTDSSAYISGINYIYEFDFGDLSGWTYHVNGAASSVGCGNYILHDGDKVEWLYTCELGNDLK